MTEKLVETGSIRIDDLYTHYLVRYRAFEYRMDFEVFTNTSFYPNYEYFRSKTDESNLNVTDPDEAEVELSGTVKWDGCTHFDFETKYGSKHLCGRSDIEAFSKLLLRVLDIAAAKIPNFDSEVAG